MRAITVHVARAGALRAGVLGSLLFVAALAVPSAAAADQRYASPTATGTACTQPSPCDVVTAINDASTGDEVIIAPGDYGSPTARIDTGIYSTDEIDVHGVEAEPRPRLYLSNAGYYPVQITEPAARLRHLEIDGMVASVSTSALLFEGALLEDVIVAGSGDASGCYILGATLVRNTTCGTAAGFRGLSASGGLEPGVAPVLRNVTVYAPAPYAAGIAVRSEASRPTSLTAIDTIAVGGEADVFVSADETQATFTASHSSFSTPVVEEQFGGDAVLNDDGTNQTAEPLLANPAAGDIHQLPGSPTIDAGIASADNGAFDIDGEPRTLGLAPDIGADEHVPAVPSNEFSFGKLKKNKKKGTAKLTVIVPGPGGVELAKTKKVKGKDKRAAAAGEVRLAIKPTPKLTKKLKATGKTKVKASVTYTPDGGTPNTQSKSLRLVKR